MPVLVLVGNCSCAATVTGQYVQGGLLQCTIGIAGQPWSAVSLTDSAEDDTEQEDGTCFVPGNPNVNPPIPDPCPLAAMEDCVFVNQVVRWDLAACALGGNGTGTPPYTLYDPFGQKVGEVTAAKKITAVVPIGDLGCRNFQDYVLTLKDAGGAPIQRYNVRAMCGKCTADVVPFTPPAPQ